MQLKGIALRSASSRFALSVVFWYAIKLTMGLRVSEEEEIEGLDIGEHGNQAYPDFATHSSSFGVAGPRRRARPTSPCPRP